MQRIYRARRSGLWEAPQLHSFLRIRDENESGSDNACQDTAEATEFAGSRRNVQIYDGNRMLRESKILNQIEYKYPSHIPARPLAFSMVRRGSSVSCAAGIPDCAAFRYQR